MAKYKSQSEKSYLIQHFNKTVKSQRIPIRNKNKERGEKKKHKEEATNVVTTTETYVT